MKTVLTILTGWLAFLVAGVVLTAVGFGICLTGYGMCASTGWYTVMGMYAALIAFCAILLGWLVGSLIRD
jgi:hypothetical protein